MTVEEEDFVQAILQERDRFFRETSKLKSELSSYENFEAERISYQKQLVQKDETINSLKRQIEMLQRKVWGKSSERYVNEDPQQRCLDFGGLDLLPEEKELAVSAKDEIEKYKNNRVTVKTKSHPVRKPLAEGLPREECHIYPDGLDLERWTELEPEITEVLERDPARWYVRMIIRHKYALKDKSLGVDKQIITAAMPVLPIAKSYAGASVLADIHINKYVYHLINVY